MAPPKKAIRNSEFVGAWVRPATKKRLRALALLSNTSQSQVLIHLIDRAPVAELCNRNAQDAEAERAAIAA